MPGNALIVSRYFPPGGGVGAFRSAKFVKYLPEFGWDSYVVSLPHERQKQFVADDVNHQQYASLADIPEARIYVDVPLSSIDKSLGDTRRLPVLAKQIPELVDRYDIDVVYQTAPPFYSLPAVAWVKQRTDVPYVVDLRDPWYLNEEIFSSIKSVDNPLWKRINRHAERVVVKYADTIVLNTPEMERLYTETYPEHAETFTTITNGYDPSDYTVSSTSSRSAETTRIIYPGRFRDGTTGFLDALDAVSTSAPLELVHFGDENRTYTRKFFTAAQRRGLTDLLDKRGYADFPTVVRNIKQSDIGLIITRKNDPTHVPAKTYDYIACDVPILAITPDSGALAQILGQFDHAYTAAHDDVTEIQAHLEHLINTEPNGLGSEDSRDQYSRQELTRSLAAVFENHQ